MTTDEYGDKVEKKPEWMKDGNYLLLSVPWTFDQVEEYTRQRIASHGFAVVVTPEKFLSPEVERAALNEYNSAQARGATHDELNAVFEKYTPDMIEWNVELTSAVPLPHEDGQGKLGIGGYIMNQWRNFSNHKKSIDVFFDDDTTVVNGTFSVEDSAREFAYNVARIMKRGLQTVKETVKAKGKVSGNNSAVAKAFTDWLTEKMKGGPGDLWSPAPKSGGSWVYGSTVTTFNAETGSSLAFMALCSALDRKPQVKDGKKRVLILNSEVAA